ncbi:MAG: hypothetical protein ABIP36_09405 [Acidimicrobiales bacterium]
MAVLAVGLAQGDDGAQAPTVLPERDNRARAALKGRPTTTTTTTTDGEQQFAASTRTLPSGPILGQPVGASLLLAGEGDDWTLVDLDSGARERVSIAADDPGQLVPVRDGVVAISDGRAVLHALPGAEPVDLGPGEQVLSSGLPDRVWIVGSARGFDGQPAGADARLVGLDGAVLEQVTLAVPYPGAATADGLVFTRDGQTHLATPTGVAVIAPGPLLGVAGKRVLYLACEGVADCRPEGLDLTTGAVVSYARTADSARSFVQAVLAPDGRLAITSSTSAGDPGVLTVYASDGGVVIEIADGSLQYPPVWLPSERGVLVAAGSGRRTVSVGPDGSPQLAAIPALEGGGVAYVIAR